MKGENNNFCKLQKIQYFKNKQNYHLLSPPSLQSHHSRYECYYHQPGQPSWLLVPPAPVATFNSTTTDPKTLRLPSMDQLETIEKQKS